MSTATWTSGVSGDWSLAADWSTGVAPADAGTAAMLSGTLAETVSVAASEYFGIGDLSIADAKATLSVAGVLSVAALGNAGTIELSGGGAALAASGALTNQGSIGVAAGAALWLDPGSSLDNTGTITLASGGTLGIDTMVALSALSRVGNTGGTVDVYGGGTLNLGGAVATSGASGLLSGLALDGGMLARGTLDNAGGQIGLYGTLDAMTWEGPLAIGAGQTVTVVGGLHVITATDSPGTVTLAGGRLAVGDSETLDHMTVVAAPAGAADFIQNASQIDGAPAGTLTLGAGFVLSQSGGVTWLQNPSGGNSGSATVNDGQILINAGSLILQEGSLDNLGTLELIAGGTVSVMSFTTVSSAGLIEASGGGTSTITFGMHTVNTDLTNLVGGVYSGGTLAAGPGSELNIEATGPMVTDNATLIYNGVGADIVFTSQSNAAAHDIRATLTTLDGTLELENGAGMVSIVPTLTVGGAVALLGGTLTANSLTIAAGASVTGSGAVIVQKVGTIVNNGLITASGGALTLSATLGGSGQVVIDAGASLAVSGDSNTIGFSGLGQLTMDSVPPIAGTIDGIVAGDTILLTRVIATSATLAGGALTVALLHGGPEIYHANGAAGLLANVSLDGKGDSLITFSAASVHATVHATAPATDAGVAVLPAGATHDPGWAALLPHGGTP